MVSNSTNYRISKIIKGLHVSNYTSTNMLSMVNVERPVWDILDFNFLLIYEMQRRRDRKEGREK